MKLIKKLALTTAFSMVALTNVHAGVGSAHLWYPNPDADILMMSVNVTKTYQHTYYETLGWNVGQEAGGYTGIQTHNNGVPVYIFSIWDPIASLGVPIKAIYAKPNSTIERFGGEGEGLKYMDFNTRWTVGKPVTSVVRRWSVNNTTHFGMWTHNEATRAWTHHTTFEFPVANVPFLKNSANSFIENWSGLYKNQTRSAEYFNIWSRSLNGQWTMHKQASPTVTEKTAATAKQHGLNAAGDRFVMQQGEDYSLGFSEPLRLTQNLTATQPNIASTQINSLEASYDLAQSKVNVRWSLNPSGAPQFRYKVEVTDATSGAIIGSNAALSAHQYNASLPIPASTTNRVLKVKLLITDILDRQEANQSVNVTTSPVVPPSPPTLPIGTKVTIQSASSKYYLSILNGSQQPVTNLVQSSLGQPAEWSITKTDKPNEYLIKSLYSNQCVDIKEGSRNQGANLIQYPCHGMANQRFSIQADNSGAYTIKALHSNQCIDVPASSTKINTSLIQWSCHSGMNQKWYIKP
ncbi:MAG: RICIN domain-containing protein [Thiofilum sp.]|uniref:DUF3472 domain-containing protein n=1 Tax=Thiofilum sp. TaxID=2212733 RepID=UPI0025D122F9|nr:RICIN domain-containing protein [Thiofilum sp.]MBK8454422.1 DUF3472 domain-containing protein [Thiofilum sp.]